VTDVRPLRPADAAYYPDKAFATVRARAALVGIAVSRITDDRGEEVFVVSWNSITKQLRDLGDVERLVETIPLRQT
jgi:hypothetical protein